MRTRAIGLAVVSGIAAFVLVGVIVTELAAPSIEFSLFVGVPAGLVAGVVTAILVFTGLERPSPARRRPAHAIAVFGAVFVVALPLGAGLFGLQNSIAIPVAAVLGVLAAVVQVLLPRRTERRS